MKEDKNELNKIQLNHLQNITSININEFSIYSISVFPSGNFLSVSKDYSIIIYDNINLNIIQHILNAHNNSISC